MDYFNYDVVFMTEELMKKLSQTELYILPVFIVILIYECLKSLSNNIQIFV